MEDQILIIIASVITIVLGLIGGGFLTKFRSFLGNLKESITAIENLMTNGATSEEVDIAIKELKETVEDGLGIWNAIAKVLTRG